VTTNFVSEPEIKILESTQVDTRRGYEKRNKGDYAWQEKNGGKYWGKHTPQWGKKRSKEKTQEGSKVGDNQVTGWGRSHTGSSVFSAR